MANAMKVQAMVGLKQVMLYKKIKAQVQCAYLSLCHNSHRDTIELLLF